MLGTPACFRVAAPRTKRSVDGGWAPTQGDGRLAGAARPFRSTGYEPAGTRLSITCPTTMPSAVKTVLQA
jgi:hypothetical protein